MLNTIVVTSSEGRRYTLHRTVVDSGFLQLHTSLGSYPSPGERRRLFRLVDAEVVIVDLDVLDAGIEFVNEAHLHWPRAAILGMDPPRGSTMDGAGISGYLNFPPSPKELRDTVNRAVHRIQGGMLDQVFAFLPSKAGIGCTTLVLNTAVALARDLGKRVLVVECDLRSGTLSLMLNVGVQGSVQSALRAVSQLDLDLLPSCAVEVHGIDLMVSSRQQMEVLPDWSQYLKLLSWASERYDAVFVDFPELVNQATVEMALRSKAVFLVSTQELLPLKLAEQRLEDLHRWGIPHDRVQMIINRFHRSDLAITEIEQYLKVPVRASIPNDYHAVRKAIMESVPVAKSSAAGRAYSSLAAMLVDPPNERQRSSGVSKLMKAFHFG